jgi:hypothetical protein
MGLTIRKIADDDYSSILCAWWKDWGWQPPNIDFLPGNGTSGLIIYDGDEPICAGFVYVTNSSVSWVDWIISSKTYNKKPLRAEAIRLLIKSLTNLCKASGSLYCYALIKSPSLIKVYEAEGYSKADVYNVEMIKKI